MRKSLLFFVVLSGLSSFSIAAPQLHPNDKTMMDTQGEIQREPASSMKQKTPGILICPEQAMMEKERVDKGNLAFSDKHSRNCEQERTDDYQIGSPDGGAEFR